MQLYGRFVVDVLLFNQESGVTHLVQALSVKNGIADARRFDLKDISSFETNTSDLRSREGFRESMVPFQLVLISYQLDSPTPYRISFFSPGNYQFIELDKEAFDLFIPRSDLHTHNTYELCLVRDGTLYQRIETERHLYPQGSCFLLNRNVRHNEEYDSSFCTITLSVSEEFLKETLREEFPNGDMSNDIWGDGTDLREFLNAELNSVDTGKKTYIDFIPSRDSAEAADVFEEIAHALLDPGPGNVFLVKNLICTLLNLLTKKEFFSTVPVELGTATEGRIFAEISKVIDQEKGRISRQRLSDLLHYSGNYLNRLTKKYSGMNLTEYSNTVAMRYASSMLLSTDLTVSEIAEELSFSNRRYFYEAFEKTYGTTPRKYRAEHAG